MKDKVIKDKVIKCCICGRPISEIFSNNAQPVKEGRCCDECNYTKVLPARFAQIAQSKKK